MKITIYTALGKDYPTSKEFDNNQEVINTLYDLVDYLEQEDTGIFLFGGKGFDCEIIISENFRKIVDLWCNFLTSHDGVEEIHIHEYKTFEDAYKVALDMREGHHKALN